MARKSHSAAIAGIVLIMMGVFFWFHPFTSGGITFSVQPGNSGGNYGTNLDVYAAAIPVSGNAPLSVSFTAIFFDATPGDNVG